MTTRQQTPAKSDGLPSVEKYFKRVTELMADKGWRNPELSSTETIKLAASAFSDLINQGRTDYNSVYQLCKLGTYFTRVLSNASLGDQNTTTLRELAMIRTKLELNPDAPIGQRGERSSEDIAKILEGENLSLQNLKRISSTIDKIIPELEKRDKEITRANADAWNKGTF